MQALGMWLISILIMKVFAISCVIYRHVIMVGHFEKSGNWIFPRFLLTPRMPAGSSLIALRAGDASAIARKEFWIFLQCGSSLLAADFGSLLP
jgi:uncharacterized membrane protein YhfC